MPHFEVELHNIIELYENSGNIHYNNEQFFILLYKNTNNKSNMVEPIVK